MSERTQIQAATEWAEMVIDIWLQQMVSLKINNPWIHAESFQQTVMANANGDVNKVVFTFDYFLRFTDMGVGKGTTLSESIAGNTNRKRKMWYSKTFLREVRILVDIMAQDYARQAQMIIYTNMEKINSDGK